MSTRIRFERRADVRIVHVENEFAIASISLFGGQVLTWQPRREAHPVLWLSPVATFDGKVAIRGGVPICWPWFGKHPSSATAPAHGYARVSNWDLERVDVLADGRTELLMSLPPEAQSGDHRQLGLSNFVRLVIGEVLDIQSTTHNGGYTALRVTEGLHTYFRISDVANAQVTGLSGCDYVDLLDNNCLRRQEGAISFGEELGRIFVHCSRVSAIEDRGFRRKIEVDSQGSRSVAVWNPGLQTASRMADLGSENWRTMVCVETANALEDGLTLAAGDTHTLSASYRVSPLV